ncbi:cell division protein FtsQ/DivIB [Corynebacterium sp.]|uniref:cell division protein FtsQ/DivIB n=1 Tax=Corynebacterium sp. TaxID=1720 RepID=UPI0026DD44A8|nr:FtsQ-type POTRA domain-containing protein [Corynebacterium sp.]MDO5031392.1 FtsQ-type POTRA domain-containing protein [Corynebacterium sp.]
MSKKVIAAVVGGVLALVLLAGAAVWVFPVLTVKSFEITGNEHSTPQEIEEASHVAQGSNLVRLDAREAASNIVSLPWVESATVSRAFPSTVRVELTEHTAVAFIKEGEATQLVDDTGEKFAMDTPPEDAVELSGKIDEDAEVLQPAVEILAALPQPLRAQVRTLEVDGRYSMTLVTKDDRRVYWGASEDNHNKAIAFEDVLKLEGSQWNISNPELVTSR